MPVIVASDNIHPFLPSLGSNAAIERERALRQDIRPLEIAVLNLMADKQTTERQLALWLGHTPLQIHLTFLATDSYIAAIATGRETRNTPASHIQNFYKGWGEVATQKFDGLVVTGVNALQYRVEFEAIWPEVQRILDWSTTHVLSSLFLCWGAKAALKHFHDIDSIKGKQKLFGLFEHRLGTDKAGLLFGFPDRFPIPVSRWKTPEQAAVRACPALDILAQSDEAGANILAETAPYGDGRTLFARRLYVLSHPEYGTDTLQKEYERDAGKNPAVPLPAHYFPGDDSARPPINNWRYTAQLYSNWVNLIYEATPFELAKIPEPHRLR